MKGRLACVALAFARLAPGPRVDGPCGAAGRGGSPKRALATSPRPDVRLSHLGV